MALKRIIDFIKKYWIIPFSVLIWYYPIMPVGMMLWALFVLATGIEHVSLLFFLVGIGIASSLPFVFRFRKLDRVKKKTKYFTIMGTVLLYAILTYVVMIVFM